MVILENIGRAVIRLIKSFTDIIYFAWKILIRIFNCNTYTSAMRTVLTDQIYFTSVQILPIFLIVSIVFGSLLIGVLFLQLKQLGLTQYIGHVLMGFIVTEFSPFITVLLITLRSGSAINTEIAVMKVNKEMSALEAFRIDAINYLLVPRVINGVISIVLLSTLFSVTLLGSGLLFSNLIFGMNIDAYATVLLNSASFSDIVVALLKSVVFGFFIILIPIRFGLQASHELTSVPVVVARGMVNVFAAVLTIEVLSLIIKLL